MKKKESKEKNQVQKEATEKKKTKEKNKSPYFFHTAQQFSEIKQG